MHLTTIYDVNHGLTSETHDICLGSPGQNMGLLYGVMAYCCSPILLSPWSKEAVRVCQASSEHLRTFGLASKVYSLLLAPLELRCWNFGSIRNLTLSVDYRYNAAPCIKQTVAGVAEIKATILIGCSSLSVRLIGSVSPRS